MENLSLGGAALSTKLAMNPGAFLRLHFSVGPGAAIDADAVLVRSISSSGAFVWGVAFVGLDATTAARIGAALRAPPPKSDKPAPSRPAPAQPNALGPAGPAPKPSPPPPAPGSRRELHDLFKEALDQVKKR
jgi:hypothetical protein